MIRGLGVVVSVGWGDAVGFGCGVVVGDTTGFGVTCCIVGLGVWGNALGAGGVQLISKLATKNR